MYKFIFRQWKNRKATVILIIAGFMIGSLVMSLGISACNESYEYISDQKMGDTEQQLNIYLASETPWNQGAVEGIVEDLSNYGEVQLLSMESKQLSQYEESYPIVPVLFQKEPNWHVPLLQGSYFSWEDMKYSKKTIVVGKYIAQKHGVKLGDTLEIEGKDYEVIGICGRKSRETSWEYAIYMSWTNYIEAYDDCFAILDSGSTISIHLEQGKDAFMEAAKEYMDGAEKKGISINRKGAEDVDSSSLRNTLILTIVSTILVFTVAVINIVHLMLYWMMERRRQIGIMKALGANNGIIVRSIILEVLAMSFIGCVSAVLIQFLAMHIMEGSSVTASLTFSVTSKNLLWAISVSLFFGMISALIPARIMMSFEPVSAISSQ